MTALMVFIDPEAQAAPSRTVMRRDACPTSPLKRTYSTLGLRRASQIFAAEGDKQPAVATRWGSAVRYLTARSRWGSTGEIPVRDITGSRARQGVVSAGRQARPAPGEKLLQIPLDRTGGTSLFLQIKRHLERLIASGVLVPGSKLPATRELARALGLNRTTVATAYDALVAEGWARAHVGQGTFVAERESAPTPTRSANAPKVPRPDEGEATAVRIDWGGALSRSARGLADDARRRAGPAVEGGAAAGVISFVGATPDATLFPTEAFRRALNDVIKREGGALLEYHPVGGYLPLRRYLATWLLRHGIETREEDVLVVTGSQQGLDLIARALLDPGDAVILEQPTYPGAIQTFVAAQAQILPVPVGPAGLRVDLVARLVEKHRPKLLYCQPSGHNPTGVSLDLAGRIRLLEIAARHRLPIIEDGFGAPPEADSAPLPLRALDRSGLVIHLGTLSKVLFPGLRVGWMVVPRFLIEPLMRIKQLADLHTGALLQAAAFQFFQGRRLERHARMVRAEYARRRTVLTAALQREFRHDVTWTNPDDSAFSLLVTLSEGLDAAQMLPRAVEHGVAYAPGTHFSVEGEGTRTLRLAYAALAPPRIEEGVRRLGQTIDEALRRHRRYPKGGRPALPVV